MTTTCPCHNNIMQFLRGFKNCQVTLLEFSTFQKKSYFNFALNVFFCKKDLKGAILFQNLRCSQLGGTGDPGPLNQNVTYEKKFCQKSLVSSFSVSFSILAYNSTLVQQ